MNRAQIFILVLFSTGAGIGIYLFLQSKKKVLQEEKVLKDVQQLYSQQELAQKKQVFCNPPTSNEIEKYIYQKTLAKEEWDKRGRGMDLDYFTEQYKKELGCPQ